MDFRWSCSFHVSLVFYLLLMPIQSIAQELTPEAQQWVPPSSVFIYFVILLVFVGSLIAIKIIQAALISSEWSIADALSEEIQLTEMDKEGQPVLDDKNQPRMITKLNASSSRMVALMGMIVILLMFLAFGSFSLYYFALTGEMPNSMDKVVKFLLAGLTLFAPYAVNKFSNLFSNFTPK